MFSIIIGNNSKTMATMEPRACCLRNDLWNMDYSLITGLATVVLVGRGTALAVVVRFICHFQFLPFILSTYCIDICVHIANIQICYFSFFRKKVLEQGSERMAE